MSWTATVDVMVANFVVTEALPVDGTVADVDEIVISETRLTSQFPITDMNRRFTKY